jgi:hypothetical protein
MMATTLVSMVLALAAGSTGGLFESHHHGGRILPPGPGYGWGFRNGNPDGYGWVDYGTFLPLGADRTAEYFFPRYWACTPEQMFLPNYYNPYLTRGQRYLSFAGCGGHHPAGGPPPGSATMPMHPYNDTIGSGPQVPLPRFSGRVEASPINSGGTGLTP